MVDSEAIAEAVLCSEVVMTSLTRLRSSRVALGCRKRGAGVPSR